MSSTVEKDLPPQAFEDEISLREIVSVLWNGKLLISSITTFFALTSIIVSLSLTNYYTSESLLISRDKQESGMSSLSGLASIAGVDLMRSNRGPLILEVNSSPGLQGIESCSEIDVAEKIILHIQTWLR